MIEFWFCQILSYQKKWLLKLHPLYVKTPTLLFVGGLHTDMIFHPQPHYYEKHIENRAKIYYVALK